MLAQVQQDLFGPQAHLFDAASDARHQIEVIVRRSIVVARDRIKTVQRRLQGRGERHFTAHRAQKLDAHADDLLLDQVGCPSLTGTETPWWILFLTP